MAYVNVYSAKVGDEGQRAYIRYEVTETETTWSVTYAVGVNAYSKNINYSGLFNWSSFLTEYRTDGTEWEKTHTVDAMKVTKGDNKRLLGTYTRSTNKRAENSTRTFEIDFNTGPEIIGRPTVVKSFTINPLKKFTVTYNANGGSGAPSSDTKWYGKTLTLATGTPVRTSYQFKGWATSATGPAVYQPEGSYIANASVTLYAVWEYVAIDPTITNLTASRCKLDGGVYVDDDEGTVARIRFNWTKGVLGGQTVSPSSIVVGIKGPSDSQPISTTLSNITDDLIDVNITNPVLDTGSLYEITVTITTPDLNTITATSYISESYFVMDVNTNGTAIGIGKAVSDSDNGLFIDMPVFSSGDINAAGVVSSKRETVYNNAEGWTPSTSSSTTVDGAISKYSQVEVHLSDGSFGICNLSWNSDGTGVILGMLAYPYNEYIYVNSVNFKITPSGDNYSLVVPSTVQMPANYRIGTSVLKVTSVRKLRKIVGLVSTHE